VVPSTKTRPPEIDSSTASRNARTASPNSTRVSRNLRRARSMMIRSRALSAAGRGHRGLREIGSYFEVKLASVVRHVEDRVERFAK
jgi:hypothetical protein